MSICDQNLGFLSVVVVNFNTSSDTVNAVKSVADQLDHKASIVVVDNGSSENDFQSLRERLEELDNPKVILLRSDENLGFSGGFNLGIKQIKSEWYLLMNSDTLFREEAISILMTSSTQAEKDIGIISPRLEYLDGTPQVSCFNFHTPISEFIDQCKLRVVDTLLKKWRIPREVSDNSTFPQWTSFACVVVKGDVLDSVGRLDEGFFLYYEDVEYCFRAAQHGWRVKNVPEARVVHFRGGSSETKTKIENLSRLPRYWYESRSRYFKITNRGVLGLFLANIGWTLGRLLCFSKILVLKKPDGVPVSQWRDIWIGFLTKAN